MREIFIKHYIDQFGLSSGKDYIINLKERIKYVKILLHLKMAVYHLIEIIYKQGLPWRTVLVGFTVTLFHVITMKMNHI